MRILVIGKEGQVARALAERAAAHGAVVTLIGRPLLDLADPSGIGDVLADISGDVVVNAAAYTAVDQAETEPELAEAINGIGAGAVAGAAAAMNLPVVQISTDYVFDGAASRPYGEGDAPEPLGAYGRSKLLGEQAVAAATANHAILRTSWIYSPFGRNFVRTMLRLARERLLPVSCLFRRAIIRHPRGDRPIHGSTVRRSPQHMASPCPTGAPPCSPASGAC
ncbi:MAG: dTDP-4-dehydrorhamnose reductase [Microvirga sp.]|nr:dTDP-4-dehydrorhamnose reductase [Microvirga sp.]